MKAKDVKPVMTFVEKLTRELDVNRVVGFAAMQNQLFVRVATGEVYVYSLEYVVSRSEGGLQ